MVFTMVRRCTTKNHTRDQYILNMHRAGPTCLTSIIVHEINTNSICKKQLKHHYYQQKEISEQQKHQLTQLCTREKKKGKKLAVIKAQKQQMRDLPPTNFLHGSGWLRVRVAIEDQCMVSKESGRAKDFLCILMTIPDKEGLRKMNE